MSSEARARTHRVAVRFEQRRRVEARDAERSTLGLEKRLKKRARPYDTIEEAEAWAKQQDWWGRVVIKQFTPRFWIWWIRPQADQ